MTTGKLIHKTRNVLFTLVAILTIASTASATTYYVDAIDGNDLNNALSTSTSWKTIGKVNSSTFYPGDQILFNRGHTWREQLNVSSSGSPGSPITFGAYGTGPKPLIKPTIDIGSNWVQYSGSGNGQIWTFTASSSIKVLWLSDDWVTYGGRGNNPADGQFMISSSDTIVVYYNPPGALDPNTLSLSYGKDFEDTIEDTFGININGKSYVTIDNIQVSNAAEIGIRMRGVDHIIVSNCDVTKSGNPTQGSYGVGNNFGIQYGNNSNILFQNCTSINPYDDGFCAEGLGTDMTGPIIFDHCTATGSGYGGNRVGQIDNLIASGFSMTNTTSGKYVNNISIEHCTSSGNYGSGVHLIRSVDTMIKYSKIDENFRAGIHFRTLSTGTVQYNLIYQNNKANLGTASNFTGNIEIWNGCSNINLYNNVIYGNTGARGVGLHVSNQDSANSTNLNIKNNIIYGNAYADLRIQTNWGAGVILDNNCYSDTNGNSGYIIVYDDAASPSRNYGVSQFAFYQSTELQDTHSMTSDPKFRNIPADFHLRSSSPCIDAGTNVSLTPDYDGMAVPFGKAPDIGAYEYRISAPTNLRSAR